MGVFVRRKWDNVEAKVYRFNTCDTPTRLFAPVPQFPVEMAYRRPSVITLPLIASFRWNSFRNAMDYDISTFPGLVLTRLTFLSESRMPLVMPWNSFLKRPANSGPARSIRLFPK